jgi:hypothetical protein
MPARGWLRKVCGAWSSRSLIFGIRLQAGKHPSRAAALLWEVILLVHSHKNDFQTVAKHLRWL